MSDSASSPSSSQKSFTSSSGGAGAPNASVYISAYHPLPSIKARMGNGRQREMNLPEDKCLSDEVPNP